jgi:hypothetical protein
MSRNEVAWDHMGEKAVHLTGEAARQHVEQLRRERKELRKTSEIVMIDELIMDLSWEQVATVREALELMHARSIKIERQPDHPKKWSVEFIISGLPPRTS